LVVQYVGSVELSAHANFNNTNLYLRFIEDVESSGGQYFEIRSTDAFSYVQVDVVLLYLAEERLFYRPVVDGYTVPSAKVR
jgi:hypothetical protein